jgi:hypothetical protein
MSPTITLPIDLELQGLLAKKAAEVGVQVETFAVDALRRVVQMPTISEIFADVGAEFEASGMTDEELRQEIEEALAEVRAERRAR